MMVVADHLRRQVAAVDGRDADPRGAPDHMAVGEHEAVGGDDHAGAGAAVAAAGLDVEPHDRRADAVDHVDDGAGIGIEQRLVLGRDRWHGSRAGSRSVKHGFTCGASGGVRIDLAPCAKE